MLGQNLQQVVIVPMKITNDNECLAFLERHLHDVGVTDKQCASFDNGVLQTSPERKEYDEEMGE